MRSCKHIESRGYHAPYTPYAKIQGAYSYNSK